MSEWQDRRRFRRWFSSRWALVLFLLVAIFLTRAVWRAWWQSRTVTAERDAAKAELAELAARRAELTRELATLETERGQETLLRQKFPIAREGEGGRPRHQPPRRMVAGAPLLAIQLKSKTRV